MRWLPFLAVLPVLLLAGCTQLDAAKGQLDDARKELDEAKARYDRISTLTAVRQETLDVTLTARIDEQGGVSFQTNATRAGVAIPVSNLTGLAPIAVRAQGSPWILCDPLTCSIRIGEGQTLDVRPTLADPIGLTATREGGALTCGGGDGACELRLAGVRAWVTTSIGDATS